ncbi:FAD-dependent thymidylate synthase [Paenibacillus pinihumi]|uniref:FAD-dependent thymidylate synthase n=1 Tax=Paenibacillus pinihumi TaxID=669462 RepID=UPI0003F4FEE0|nr:FAD-dependent thymidylate synthase [Paenibacillus pinihumi]
MNVKLIAHTKLSDEFIAEIEDTYLKPHTPDGKVNHRAAIALIAIRTCYSPMKPSEILPSESGKYFGSAASDGEGGAESDRLFRHIIRSKHTSTLEHITYTFAVEGVSRALLAQLTRHRIGFSYSVQSQRYVRFSSEDKSGGFDYVTPPSVNEDSERFRVFDVVMNDLQAAYDELRALGVPAEDARMVLPNAAACNLVMTVNLRALLEFYAKRRAGSGAQWEIADLSEKLREEVAKVDPWTAKFFECP